MKDDERRSLYEAEKHNVEMRQIREALEACSVGLTFLAETSAASVEQKAQGNLIATAQVYATMGLHEQAHSLLSSLGNEKKITVYKSLADELLEQRGGEFI